MRRVRYSVAMSLDGYIAGPNGEFDWIPMDPAIDFAAMIGRFDTLLMGRKSWQPMAGQPSSGQGAANPFAGLATIVFSRTLDPAAHPGVSIAADPATTVPALKAAPGKDIWLFGGGELFRSLLDLGLVDAVEVAVIPILLGAGRPLLPGSTRRSALTLVSERVYRKTGTVLLEYAVAR
jgi:dihydrofolate reductase